MSDYLPKEVREGLELARKRSLKRRARLRVHFGDEVHPVKRVWENGFALDRDDTEHLRGLVDVCDGDKLLYQALIVASHDDGQEMCFEFKRSTMARSKPALDYVRAEQAPIGLLPKS